MEELLQRIEELGRATQGRQYPMHDGHWIRTPDIRPRSPVSGGAFHSRPVKDGQREIRGPPQVCLPVSPTPLE